MSRAIVRNQRRDLGIEVSEVEGGRTMNMSFVKMSRRGGVTSPHLMIPSRGAGTEGASALESDDQSNLLFSDTCRKLWRIIDHLVLQRSLGYETAFISITDSIIYKPSFLYLGRHNRFADMD